MSPARRLDFPATRRNRDAIFDVLAVNLPPTGLIVEIASGSGQHGAAFAARLPNHRWQPTDLDPAHIASCDAWRADLGSTNLLPALRLDASADTWPIDAAAVVFSANMVHIAPWAACEGLFRGAARILPTEGMLILYGPFLQQEITTAPSNIAFDQSLRSRDPSWGIRHLDALDTLATSHGFSRQKPIDMPANNVMLIFAKTR